MIKFASKQVAEEWKEAFGFPITDISERGMWVLVKLFKHARGRCRSNTAMNNWLRDAFTGHQFNEIDKVDERTGKSYKGLEIKKL